MEHSQPFISESESSLLNESLFNRNGEVEGNRVQEGDGRKQEIVIRTWLLEKYPRLFDSTIQIFQERSSNQELKKKASEYQEIKHRFHEQVKLSSGSLPQQSQIRENKEEINVFAQHLKLQNKIKQIHGERQEQMSKIQQMDVQKQGNRLKIKLLMKIIKDAKQNYEIALYANIDEQYRHQLDQIIFQSTEIQRSQFGIQSQSSSIPDQQDIQRHEQSRRQKIKQQIIKLQTQEQVFHKITSKQKQIMRKLKQEIKRFQDEQSAIYHQINHTEDNCLKREILRLLVERFIHSRMKDEGLERGFDKPIQQYVQEIANLEHQTQSLKRELQLLSLINTQKLNACILLEKRLSELQKQSRLSIESMTRQGQVNDSSQTQQINNQERILKTYMFEGNKIQSQMSQMQHKHQGEEVERFLEERNQPSLECNQKVIVKKQKWGWILRILPIKNAKHLLIALIIWFLILVILFSWRLSIHSDYLFTSPIKSPRTIVHRYQGRTHVVDGNLVNISHFDENAADIDGEKQSMMVKENPIQQQQMETIVVETAYEQPKKTWKELLVMEYK